MIRMRKFVLGISGLASLAFVTLALAQSRPTPPQQTAQSTHESLPVAIDIVRQINTAEVEFNARHGAFASWEELHRSPDEQKRWQSLQVSAGPEIFPGWKLRLVIARDGQSFDLSLTTAQDKCGLTFFSDDRGVIYEGRAIGCSSEAKSAR